MKEQEIDSSILDCFNENGEYTGGIYSFKMNGTTYYTTFADLNKSYASGSGDAYKDAMNQYNYENAQYDKMVQDINVKTSLIQQEDQQLELRLKQLDTEQNALSTEIDAVSKVVKDNIEDSFKTFGGQDIE